MLRILHGDCRETLKALPDASVQCCVTSPPYFGLRDYGCEGQIGLEATPEAFVSELVAVFREVRRVLADDGTVWLNLGDSYTSMTRGGRTEQSETVGARGAATPKHRHKVKWGKGGGTNFWWRLPAFGTELKPKDLMGIPWRVAFALQADGWYLRQDIIWNKPNPMPESVEDRCTKAHEYIFLLSKSARYHFDAQAIAEAAAVGWNDSEFHRGKTAEHQLGRASKKRKAGKRAFLTQHGGVESSGLGISPETRNKRSVWTVASQPYKGAHFATFPPDLITPCILAGCPVGGTVLDPFGGSGTTGKVAIELGRKAVLCELNPEYVKMIEQRTTTTLGLPLSA